MAYVLLPPAGGVLLLIMEHKSDYVRYGWWWCSRSWGRVMLMRMDRFHAWQSSLLFAFLVVGFFSFF